MAQPHIQTAFHTGEWAPTLNARVDLQKYHSAAAILENFFVDYRGGASSRMGTKYILQAYKSATAIRLITFQASFTVGYVMEFGDFYIRFFNNGSPVLETAKSITSAAAGPPEVFTSAAHGYSNGEWLFIENKYYIVQNSATNTFTLTDLFGVAINTNPFTLPTNAQRVYTLPSPYAAADLALLKFVQNVDKMVFTHPNYAAYELILISAANWTITPIVYGSTITTPTGASVATTLAAGTVNYAYCVTAVDSNGQESGPSTFAILASRTDLRTVAGTNTISWNAVSGAVSYNVYKTQVNYTNPVPAGSQMGFIGNCTGVNFIDSNISPDYSLTPPVAQNPFFGAGVASITVTAPGVYTSVPTVTVAAPPSGGTALASAVLGIQSVALAGAALNGWHVGDIVGYPNGISLVVATVSAPGGSITSFQPLTYPGSNRGSVTSGSVPANPLVKISGAGLGQNINVTWGVTSINVTQQGSGYLTAPAVTVSAGGATATSTLGPATAGNPSVPGLFNQRLFLGAPTRNPQAFNLSKPGAYYNFDNSNPTQPSDAIAAQLSTPILNTIKSTIAMPSGLIVLCDRQAFLLNNGQGNAGITAIDATANSQAYNGASDVPPIVSNFDILYVQSKGSIVRDLTYNFYTNIFTGTDISVLSSHLFYGYQLLEWAYCEEPFKLIWAVRNDGQLLCLTFLKEQELLGWTHSITDGLFKSVASVIEQVSFGAVDALYTCVERTINGQTVQYIERMAERYFPNGVRDAWCVDAGLQYNGAPATSFSGGEHLAGATVTGLADGLAITPFVMPASGDFTLPTAASKVTIGLAFEPILRTLPLDLGEPTIQGKRKKIVAVTVRAAETLGLEMGTELATLQTMKDFAIGNVGTQTNQLVTGLVTGDGRMIIDQKWDEAGNYYVRQPVPMPCTILGVIPEVAVGDTIK